MLGADPEPQPRARGPLTPAPPARVPVDVESSLAALFADTTDDPPELQPRILTVCTGNICRSPLAETVLAARLTDPDVRVHSAGTQALVGHGMPEEARRLAEHHGADPARIAAHQAQLLTEALVDDADLVLAMSAEHSTAALRLSPRRLHRTFTVREFARLAATLDDGVLRSVARGAGTARSRFAALVQAVSDQRGVAPRAVGDEDVIDPYRRSAEVYAQSAEQLVPALDQVERVVRIALVR